MWVAKGEAAVDLGRLGKLREIAQIFGDTPRREFASRGEEDGVVARNCSEHPGHSCAVEFDRERIAMPCWGLQNNERASNIDRDQLALQHAGQRCFGRHHCMIFARKLVARWSFQHAEFGEIAGKGCLRCFNAIAREQLGQLGLAVNLTGRDNVSDQGVSARFHGVARYACICSGRKNIHCSG